MSQFIAFLAAAILLLSFFAAIFFNFYKIVAAILRYFFSDYYNQKLPFIRLNNASKKFLENNISYYQRLSPAKKVTFEKRVQKFINSKSFETRQELPEATVEMKTLVAASAIQITFGFPSVYLDTFHTIIFYPGPYQSTLTGNFHRGEVHTKGYIVLSWPHLVHGYKHNEGRNLALHEMAHALRISDASGREGGNFMETALLAEFVHYARIEMAAIQAGEPSFFRDYAAANDDEFFSVAVENFFERPAQFLELHPVLFDILGELLNQKEIIRRQIDSLLP